MEVPWRMEEGMRFLCVSSVVSVAMAAIPARCVGLSMFLRATCATLDA